MVNGNLYTVKYFAKLNVGKMLVYQAMAKVGSGESHLHGAEARRPLKLSKTQVVETMENKSGSSQPMRDPIPLSTDVLVMNILI